MKTTTLLDVKKDFPLFKEHPTLVYVDSASIAQCPTRVIDVQADFARTDHANVSRGLYSLSESATQKYSEARQTIADFINADREEIIFTKNTTESLNALAYTLPSIIPKWKNEIVLTEMEHHSNLVPWQQLAKRLGWVLNVIRMNEDYTLDMEDAKAKINEKTAIVSITHMSNALGTVNPILEIVRQCREHGAVSVIDAAQSVAHIPLDIRSLGCDFLVFSGHKTYGPTGVGVLYGRRELLEKLDPFQFGGGMIRTVSFKESTWADVPEKFEAGTPDVSGVIGLAEAIHYIHHVGFDKIQKHEEGLTAYARAQLHRLGEIVTYSSEGEQRGPIISFTVKDVHPHDVASLLNEYDIAIRAGHHCCMPLMERLGINGTCRISFSMYNTKEDVDALVSALKDIIRRFADG